MGASVAALLLLLVGRAHAVALTASGGLSVEFGDDGTYRVRVDGVQWLSSGNPPRLWGQQLTLTGPPTSSTGSDKILGSYHAVEALWKSPGGTPVKTSILTSDTRPVVVFRQSFPSGAKTETPGRSSSEALLPFPSFAVKPADLPLNYLHWGGNQLNDTNISRWGDEFMGDSQRGVPVCLFTETLRTLMFGPHGHFLVSIHAGASEGRFLDAGIKASVSEVPPGFAYDTIMLAGQGMNDTVVGWGDLLLEKSGKRRVDAMEDFVLSQLGYWTDNGAYYYARHHDGFANSEEALKAVKSEMQRRGIPVKYYQWDDWWYKGKGDWGGMTEWVPLEDVFPSGFSRWLDSPLSLYMAMISSLNVYHGKYRWVDDAAGHSIPVDKQFYMDLFANGTGIGMKMFEQDFLSQSNYRTNLTSSDVHSGDLWLDGMNEAALAYNVSLQLCMMDPIHTLKSSEMQAVTNGRAARDAIGQVDRLLVMGLSGMLHYSVGIWPSADNVRTNQTEGGQTRPDTPDYQNMLAVLMGGPYGPSDAVGTMDKDLVMRACRTDGQLLRASKPLTAVESSFKSEFSTARHVYVWGTHTDIGEARWGYVVGLNLVNNYTVPTADIHPDTSRKYVAYEYWGGPEKGLVAVGPSAPLVLPSCPRPSGTRLGHQYYIAAPVLAGGWVYLGEPQKFVVASPKRVVRIVSDTDSIEVTLALAAAEHVRAAFLTPEATASLFAASPASPTILTADITAPSTCPATGCRIVVQCRSAQCLEPRLL